MQKNDLKTSTDNFTTSTDKFTTLTDKFTLYLMCIRPQKNCPLLQKFNDVENIKTSAIRIPGDILLITMALQGVESEKKELLPMVQSLVKSTCQTCQSNPFMQEKIRTIQKQRTR